MEQAKWAHTSFFVVTSRCGTWSMYLCTIVCVCLCPWLTWLKIHRLCRYGPVYRVRKGDSLMTIAARFETTLRKLLSVNPHIVVAVRVCTCESNDQ